ncbi:MAG: VWA domain-containing protein [Planctomycetes bacterium]|nr:VWA domain-containing protein [Planctomycetota bacterium]
MGLLQRIEPTGVEQSLRLLDLPAAWVVVLVVLPLFAFVAWTGYSRENLTRPMRATLLALRLAAFVLLGLVLARPVRVERREEVHPAEVVVLMDDSASMRRSDSYGDDKMRRALEEVTGLTGGSATRLELARQALERGLLPQLTRGAYRVELYSFAESATPIHDLSALDGRGGATHLGDALFQTLSGQRGRNVTDVVVVSDGRSNGGMAPLDAARAAGAAGIPVHTVVVGDTRTEKNAVLELVDAPGEALEGDELGVTVRVRGRGTAPGEKAQVLLEEVESDGQTRVLAEEELELTEGGERVVLIAPAGSGALGRNERRLRVSVPNLEGETLIDDNRLEFSVNVSPARIRVLFVEGYPRWEYRFVKNLLLRADKNVDVQCFLLSATKDFPQESSPGLAPLGSVPTTREELLAKYDVVILGDVDPYAISPDPKKCEDFLHALREFVEAGGGLLFQAGELHNPRALVNTPLEDVLPVQLDPTRMLAFEGDTKTEFRPRLEDAAHPHEILRLSSDPNTNRALWEDPEQGLRGFYWYMPIQKVKPGAQVLLRHPTDRNVQTGESYPLMVLGYFPAGRTLFLAVDSTYRWRYRYGDRYLDTFWRNSIRWLALGRLKSGDRRYRIESSRSTYDIVDRVQLEVRVLDEDYRPSQELRQRIGWSGPDDLEHGQELTREPDRPGVYRGALEVDRPGVYHAWVEGRIAGRVQRASTTEFEVVLPSRENQDPAPDPEALRELAAKTGGQFVELARIRNLATQFPGNEERREPISSRLEDAWDGWHTLALALTLLGLEWILRKRAELL